MTRLLWALAAVSAVVFGSLFASINANAADVGGTPHYSRSAGLYCQEIWRCGPAGCDWHRVCSRPCPDGMSCAPLYGAYGPYGGQGYWGGYSDIGWSHGR